MKEFSPITKSYLFLILLLGGILLTWNLSQLPLTNWLELLALMAIGSAAMIIKVEGATNRWHFSVNFLIYGFCILSLGTPGTMLVILVSNLAYWIWYRSDYKGQWFIITFNIASFIVVTQVASQVYQFLNPERSLQTWTGAAAIILAMLVFTLLNHLIIGIIVWMARGENFAKSGVFEFMPLMIDLTLLVLGASLNMVWDYNPFGVILFTLPLYLMYSTLRVPALERQTEIDQKTGLFNHGYFMQQFDSELTRANRFNRPLSVILGDLDLLRNINNSFGHLAGDEVLRSIAKILKEMVREYDIVARFGGEEFAILMPETTGEIAYARAEEIRKAIQMAEHTIPTSVTPIRATISFGVATRENDQETKEEIIHKADTVLYYSKLKGRNRTYIYTGEDFKDLPSVSAKDDLTFGDHDIQHLADGIRDETETHYFAAYTRYRVNPKTANTEPAPESTTRKGTEKQAPENSTNLNTAQQKRPAIISFIASLVGASLILFLIFYRALSPEHLWGLVMFAAIIALTEWYSVDIYLRETAISTSAVPLLAGVLIFGPVGALSLSVVFSLTAYLKSRGPINRAFFNAANQLIAAMICLGILNFWELDYLEWEPVYQLVFCTLAMILTFGVTTFLVSAGMSLSRGEKIQRVWITQFSWLTPYYLVMGLMAYALVFGYLLASYVGVILILAPLMMIRFSQAQYIERTKRIVIELREKNLKLERNAIEIAEINSGLLDTLAEVIDLRDAYVLSHSRRVTNFAVKIAQGLRLSPRQVEIVRRASLLHDVGKLGIPDTILRKPAVLTQDEFEIIHRHPELGAALLEKSGSLRNLIPFVRYHHEKFDGSGYPDGLNEAQIPLEARIIAVADAIEAMTSDRPYRKARTYEAVIAELMRCSGTQFDPEVVNIAIRILTSQDQT